MIKCKCCDRDFETTNANKRYCSKECHDISRKIYVNDWQKKQFRRLNHTVEKWVGILRDQGYVVILPSKLVEI